MELLLRLLQIVNCDSLYTSLNSRYKVWRYKKIEDQENKYISDSAISIVFLNVKN